MVWGEVFRGLPALANVEFLGGYTGCPLREGVELAIALALNPAGGHLPLHALAERVALGTGLDERLCTSAILRLAWERVLFMDVRGPTVGPHTLVSSTTL